jgi:hypothetical protein
MENRETQATLNTRHGTKTNTKTTYTKYTIQYRKRTRCPARTHNTMSSTDTQHDVQHGPHNTMSSTDTQHDVSLDFPYMVYPSTYLEDCEDTKGLIRIRISKKNRQHNGQKKKYKRTNNDLQNIHIKIE